MSCGIAVSCGLLSLLAHFFEARGITLTTTCESPAGAGIGGSSALNVAVCAALARWSRTHYEPEALLRVAMNIEAQAIGVPTGLQDYRPALYGGIATLELDVDGIRRIPLDVDPSDLERRIVLCYTGQPRDSGTNNWDIMKKHIDGDRHVFDCFERIRDTAVAMRDAMARRDWNAVGLAIGQEWENRKRLAPGVSTPAIDALIARAMRAGGVGGQGVRCGRRRVPVLLRAAGPPRRHPRGSRQRRSPLPRIPHRSAGPRAGVAPRYAAIARALQEKWNSEERHRVHPVHVPQARGSGSRGDVCGDPQDLLQHHRTNDP